MNLKISYNYLDIKVCTVTSTVLENRAQKNDNTDRVRQQTFFEIAKLYSR